MDGVNMVFEFLGLSEVNILRTIIHYKKYELLKHPLCELFLHLKWKRAHGLYYLVKVIHIIFTLLVVFYTLVYHGELKYYGPLSGCGNESAPTIITNLSLPETPPSCKSASFLPISIAIISSILFVIHTTKILQNRHSFDWSLIREYILEDVPPLMGIFLFVINQVGFMGSADYYDIKMHRILAGLLVLVCCHSMAYTMARDSENAIFIEMMFKIMGNLCKFLLSYIWLFIGWFAAFHVVMGIEPESSFHDIGSAFAKTVTMFTGDLGFETAHGFGELTKLDEQNWFGFLVLSLYIAFICEMSVVLMNQLIGLAICNIQELAEDADGLRLVRDVMLQKYMESLLHLPFPSLPRRCNSLRSLNHLGQLVTKDIYNGNAIYSVDHDSFESGCYNLQLSKKENSFIKNNIVPGTAARKLSCNEVSTVEIKTVSFCNIPSSVVNKLKNLLQGNEQKNKEKDEKGQNEIKKILLELKVEIEDNKAKIGQLEEFFKRSEIFFNKSEAFMEQINTPSNSNA